MSIPMFDPEKAPAKFAQSRSPQMGIFVATCVAMALGVLPTMMGTFPVFLHELSGRISWGEATIPRVFLLTSIVFTMVTVPVGKLLELFGARRVMLVGILGFGAAFAAMALTDLGPIPMTAIYMTAAFFAPLCGPVVCAAIISGWFERGRGVALSVVLTVAPMLATAIMAPVAQILIDYYGWKAAYLIIGGSIVLLGGGSAFLLMRDAPVKTDEEHQALSPNPLTDASLGEALRSRVFWVLCLTAVVGGLLYRGISSHLLSIAGDVGIGENYAVGTLSAISLFGLFGALVAGQMVERLRPRWSAIWFVMALAGVLLLRSTSAPVFLAGGALMGGGAIAEGAVLPYLLGRYFGLRHFGLLFGICAAMCAVSQGASPLIIGAAHTSGASFDMILIVSAGLFALLALATALFLQAPTRNEGTAGGRVL